MTGASAVFASVAFILMVISTGDAEDRASAQPAHMRTDFGFTLPVPLARAAPLFGPEGERCWAGEHWNPEFVYPQPAADVEGAVFTIQHGTQNAVWVNTLFDLAAGRMQYVNFVPGVLVSKIDVHLTATGETTTRVEVTYLYTALSAAANEHVREMVAGARSNGVQWQEAIERCLSSGKLPTEH